MYLFREILWSETVSVRGLNRILQSNTSGVLL